ncbi:DUF2375 family protein [Thalassotalea maritima]|uniref:DUF2375 family protein n=1 Tax=Thalassotalea maritima TaxID=3242416 RepID=UPI003529A9BF
MRVTVIYYHKTSLELLHDYVDVTLNEYGKVLLSKTYRRNKSILAVYPGELSFISKIGERIINDPLTA